MNGLKQFKQNSNKEKLHNMTNTKQILASILYQLQAVKKGNFTLKSGAVSDIYVDIRLAALSPSSLTLITECIICLIIDFMKSNELCIGCDEGPGPSTILGAIISKYNVNGFVIRKQIKEHGTQKPFEGTFTKDIVFIEDVATTGQSTINAIEKMPNKPKCVVVVVDREAETKEALNKIGVELHSIFTLNELRNFNVIK